MSSHSDTPIWRAAVAAVARSPTEQQQQQPFKSLYDELFSDTCGARFASEVFFGHGDDMQGVADYVYENYGEFFSERSKLDLRLLRERGGAFRQLIFVLFVLAHDKDLRHQLEDVSEPDQAEKVASFYRPLAIAVRSLYCSPFRSDNVKSILLTTVDFLRRAWVSCDTSACELYCNQYAARCRSDADVENSAKQTAEWIARMSSKKTDQAGDDDGTASSCGRRYSCSPNMK